MNRANLLVTAVVVVVSLVGLRAIEQRSRQDVGNALQGVLSTAQQGLSHWADQRLADAEHWGADPRLAELTAILLATPADPEALRTSTAQTEVRALLGPVLATRGYRGFFLISPDGLNLASARDANIGVPNLLLEQPSFLPTVLAGGLRLSHPLFSDVPLDPGRASLRGEETMFVGGPVRGSDGQVLAVLTFRVEPDDEFSELLSFARLGETGETYSFDADGRMLTTSRFEPELRAAGLLEPEASSILNIELRDPGVNLAAGEQPRDDSPRPLTRMAASATRGETGSDVDGYSDYRGVRVVGAWLWDDERGFGLATEQDVAEAFYSMRQVRRLTLATLGLVVLLTLGLLAVQGRSTRRVLEAAAALEASEARHRVVARAANDGLVTIDSKGTILFANAATEAIFGWTEAELLGQPVTRLMDSEATALHTRGFDRAARTGERTRRWSGVRVEGMHRDGRPVPLEVSFGDVEQGGERLFIGVLRDVTERERSEADKHALEAQLNQAQKLESIGRLAGGVAHDFNNILTVILNYSSFVEDSLPVDSPVREDIGQVLKASERAAALSQRLLAFARRRRVEPTVLDVNDRLLELHALLQRLIGEDMRITTLLGDDLAAVLVDPGQLDQIVINLVVNARDATSGAGQITVRTRPRSIDAEEAAGADLAAGDFVQIEVTDAGPGMSEELRARVFEPFFTTKGDSGGTGLGLATCHQIAVQAGGSITVDSVIGEGTTFTVLLPACGEQPAAQPAHAGEPPRGGQETVLVAEDDVASRAAMVRTLQGLGYRVEAARHGEEALRLDERMGGTATLLVTDTLMPLMGGVELATKMVERRPALRVLFTSGRMDDALEGTAAIGDRASVLQKPFPPSALARKVREILDARSSADSSAGGAAVGNVVFRSNLHPETPVSGDRRRGRAPLARLGGCVPRS